MLRMYGRQPLYAARVDVHGSGPGTANENLLIAAREALGLTQAQLATRLSQLAGSGQPISQGYVSRAEKGALTVSGERLTLFAEALMCTPELLASDAKLWSLGDGCLYHRNRVSTRASTLRQLHAQVNLVRLYLHRLTVAAGRPLPDFTWAPVVTGGIDSAVDAARAVRERCGIGDGPIRSVAEVAEQMCALVVALPLGGREVDATSLHPPGEPPLFIINSDVSADRQRFTLGHELGHVACEAGFGSDPEKTAQEFSGELLAPARQLYADLKAAEITPARLLQLKRKWLISAAAVLYRAHDLAEAIARQEREPGECRCEHAQHAGNGALVDGFVDVDGLGVIVLHHVEDAGEVAHGALVVVRRVSGGADIGAVNSSKNST